MTDSLRPKLVWYQNGEEVVPDYCREIMKDGSLNYNAICQGQTHWHFKVVAENVAGKEGEVKLYMEDEKRMTKPKQGKDKSQLKTKDTPVATFGRYVEQ